MDHVHSFYNCCMGLPSFGLSLEPRINFLQNPQYQSVASLSHLTVSKPRFTVGIYTCDTGRGYGVISNLVQCASFLRTPWCLHTKTPVLRIPISTKEKDETPDRGSVKNKARQSPPLYHTPHLSLDRYHPSTASSHNNNSTFCLPRCPFTTNGIQHCHGEQRKNVVTFIRGKRCIPRPKTRWPTNPRLSYNRASDADSIYSEYTHLPTHREKSRARAVANSAGTHTFQCHGCG